MFAAIKDQVSTAQLLVANGANMDLQDHVLVFICNWATL
jgi:hypothetical protein